MRSLFDEEDFVAMGKRLRFQRNIRECSASEVAKILHVEESEYLSYEAGTRKISAIQLEKLEKKLKMDACYIETGRIEEDKWIDAAFYSMSDEEYAVYRDKIQALEKELDTAALGAVLTELVQYGKDHYTIFRKRDLPPFDGLTTAYENTWRMKLEKAGIIPEGD